MSDVSARVFDVKAKLLEKKGVPVSALFEGAPDVERAWREQGRIEWRVYTEVMRTNVRRLFTDEELIEIGGGFFHSPVARFMSVVGRLLFNARDFYRWVNQPNEGAGNQMFTCVRPSFEDLGPNRMRVRLSLPPGYPCCPEFFQITKGSFIHMPRLIGLPKADVELTLTESGAVYEIRYPAGGGTLSWTRRLFSWPFTARAAARELSDAHNLLRQRYQELESARARLHIQATQLRTAHRISQIVHGDLDLDHTLDAVQQALLDEAGFAAVEIRLLALVEDLEVARVSSRGTRPKGHAIARDIEIRGRRLGELMLWPPEGEAREAYEELCSYVVPTVAMALDNALTFTALVDYRSNLEAKVDERTEELKEARDRLATTVKTLETAQAARDRIFANINHEIRTPLSLILLAARDLERKESARLSPASRERLAHIEQSVQRLLHLVDGLLLLAAGREEKLRLGKKRTDLALLLQQIAATWTPATDEAGLSLSYRGPERSLALVDPFALERAVTNLLSNAVKFTPPGGSIELSLIDEGDDVRVEVRDTGIGVDDAARERLFGRFEQDRAAVRPGSRGSGIGLAIVKEIVEAHGGTVGFETNRSGGSIFFLRLPRGLSVEERVAPLTALVPLQLTPEAAGVRAPGPEEAVLQPEHSEATVLVAEDEPELRRAIGELLAERYRVVLAKDGLEALRLAREHRPDLLITDLGMPGMDGLELTERFRELPENRLSPVIVLTAYGALEDRLSGFEAGALDYVTKPFSSEELLARVRSQLSLRALALRLHESEKLASLGTLSAALAHELRNPANGIANAIEPLLEVLPESALEEGSASRQLLDVIQSCAAQIRELSRELLGFARPGAPIEGEEQLEALVSRALTVAEQPLRGLTVSQQLDYGGPVRCAGHLIVQVLVNLLENAAHAAGPGGTVGISARLVGDCVVVDVADSGPGVPPEMKHRIFEPFFTTKEPGKGTGLGLYTARRVAEQHGGELSCETRAEGGCFRLRLPVRPRAPGLVGAGGAASLVQAAGE